MKAGVPAFQNQRIQSEHIARVYQSLHFRPSKGCHSSEEKGCWKCSSQNLPRPEEPKRFFAATPVPSQASQLRAPIARPATSVTAKSRRTDRFSSIALD